MTEIISLETVIPTKGLVEALLFVSPTAMSVHQLALALEKSPEEIDAALAELAKDCQNPGLGRGLRLQEHRGRYQLTTVPQAARAAERLLGLEETGYLSRAALETLAIIMYRQPVTRPQIDAVRGVNSDGVLKSLLLRGLIQEVGRAEAPGRPILYSVTTEFLHYFGLNSLAELPPLNLEEVQTNGPSEPSELLKG